MIRSFLGKRTLEQSFAISTALLVVLLVGITMTGVHTRVAAILRSSLEKRGQSMARSIGAVATPSLLAYNYAALQVAAEGAAVDEDVAYVVIHDKEGRVAGSAGPFDSHGSLDPATLTGPAVFYRVLTTREGGAREVMELAVPVAVEGVSEVWGTVRVGLSMESAAASLRRIDIGLLGLGLALGFLAVATGRWVARRITAPIRSLAAGTEALSAGDMEHRIPVRGARELADLAQAFNDMMDRVQEKAEESERFQNALEALNATLEEQVRLRTLALQESEAQYKSLVEDSPDGILIVQEGKIRFVNRAFQEIFGVTEEEACEEDFRLEQVLDDAAASMMRERIRALERGEPVSPTEIAGRDRRGRSKRFELRGSQVEYRGGLAAECILVDTTEARALREHLEETERLRALGELAGGVAHDFNNLLGAILGRTQLLRRRGFEPEVDAALGVIETAAMDGRETVRRIQEFSRTRKDRRFGAVSLAEILRDAMEITRTRWEAEATSRNVGFDVSLEADAVPDILGNASELREVFTNLILNAVDAMPQGGGLRLSCRESGGRVQAIVADTGVGMTEEIRKHLFDPFFSTKGTAGLGLGMAMVYGIVTRHEGTIEVETRLGKGTRFVLDFPVCTESDAEAVEQEQDTHEPGRTGRILIIDDEQEIADILRDVLVAHGHMVSVALSGREGVSLALGAEFDVVFTDLGMPDMSGWEVAARIGEECPDIPVALCTGWGNSLDEQEVIERGIVAVIHKPFEIDEVVRATSRILAEFDAVDERAAG